MSVHTQTATNVFGGPYNGFSTIQTTKSYRDTEIVDIRKILKYSWNGQYATGSVTGSNGKVYSRITTPFRAVNNSGDFLGRQNYSCGGPNPINLVRPEGSDKVGSIPNMCDGTGIPPSSCNVRYVADSSDYTTFRKQRAINKQFNDISAVGDKSNGSFVARMAVQRGF